MDVHGGQLDLHLLNLEEAERIVHRQRLPHETWAPGYPSFEQIDYMEAYLLELRLPRAKDYWQAQLRRRIDGLVVGGAGVTGPPDAGGAVVIGYELTAGMPDELYGVDILRALIGVARAMGATRVTTSLSENDPRRQIYLEAGLDEVRRAHRVVHLGRDI